MSRPRLTLKTPKEIEALRHAGQVVAQAFRYLEPYVKPGVSLLELDQLAEDFVRSKGARPAYIGYNGFPNTICTAVNDGICHGIPNTYRLREGDIVGVDIGVELSGYYGDACYTYTVGAVSPQAKKLVATARAALQAGIDQVKNGARMGDVGAAIQATAESQGFSVVREYIGHGIGKNLHEAPDVPHHGNKGAGIKLQTGMVFTIEPMINVGHYATKTLADNWTVVTADGSLSAQFEHTLAITPSGVEILTI